MNEVTIISDVSALSADDLVTEYNKLANHYRNTKEYVEKCEQELFEVKRNMELSSKREKFLNQELESITEVHEKELIDATNKHNVEINHFRSRVAQAEQMIADSDAEIERMKEEMDAVSKDLKTKQAIQHDTTENTCVLSDSQLEYFGKLEKDQMNILQDLDTLKDKLKETVQQLARKEIELENLQDRFECSQENFRSKSHELDEKCQTVDSLQEKIVELTMALAEYKSGNNESSKKGNSLFAEVDDQRQHMKQMLAAHKQQYLKMKREHQEGQLKIRRLQRENTDMYREIQQCSQMFQNANHYYKKSLNNTIGFLEGEVSKLREKLRISDSRLVALAKDCNVTWLESMLEYCKKETDTIKDQLHLTRLRKCEAEELYVESKEQAAKWRFEALKSRCIIVDREILLEQNNIEFGPSANAGCAVRKCYANVSNETPDISDSVPLTCTSSVNIAQGSEPQSNSSVECLNDSKLASSPSLVVEKSDNLSSAPLSSQPFTESSLFETDNPEFLTSSHESKCSLTDDDKTCDMIDLDSNSTIDEQKINNFNAKPPFSATLSSITPHFRPINISSERMKVLSQSLSDANVNNESKMRPADLNKSRCRPNISVKHIVFKRD